VNAAVAAGGALGTLARYALGRALPEPVARFPWTTLAVNVAGSLVLGALMYVLLERRVTSPLLRPFLGVGVLGGFTTFSTFAVQAVQRADHHLLTAAGYVCASATAGLAAVFAGAAAVRGAYGVAGRGRR
jgi:CrcB protein